LVSWRYRHVQSGQSVVLRPVSSRYQLPQPEFHTVPFIWASRAVFNDFWASARTSKVAIPRSSIVRNASTLKSSCEPLMYTIEVCALCPRRPYSTRLVRADTVITLPGTRHVTAWTAALKPSNDIATERSTLPMTQLLSTPPE